MLQFVALVLIFVALITTLILAPVSNAVTSTNKTVSFQGRLLTSGGAIVADGYYNIQFKIYQDGSGTAAGNPGGSLKWTESYVNAGGTNGVEVRNGYFSVALGSINQFGSSVDWNQDTLWLSMNVAGSAAACSTFGSAPCTADGEMLPMKQITATPYAINAGAVGGKTADNFIQLAQGVQTDASLNTSSIFVNKTGTGNIIQLQNAAQDVSRVSDTGHITLGNTTNKEISIDASPDDLAGRSLSVKAGAGGNGSGATGGSLILQGGDSGGSSGDGGAIAIEGGNRTGSGTDGSIYIGSSNASNIQIGNNSLASGSQTIRIGDNNTAGGTTNVIIGSGGTAQSGSTTVQGKDSVDIKTNGTTRATFSGDSNSVSFGNGVSSDTPSDFKIQGTASSASGVGGGALTIQGGGTTVGNANGGNLTLAGGAGSGTGTNGLVVIGSPTFTSAGTQSSGTNVNVTQSNIDSFGVVTLNATAADINFTLGAPSLGANATGRIVYVTAANGSQNFILRANTGAGEGVEQVISMRQNSTTTMLWNGTLWTAAGSANPTTLQDAYDASQQKSGSAEILAYNYGLTVKNGNATTTNSTLLDVQSSSTAKIFSVNSGTAEYASNGGAEIPGASSSTFNADHWGVAGVSTVERHTTKGPYIESGNASVKVSSAQSYSGGYNKLTTALAPSTTYTVSLSVKLQSGTFTNFGVIYAYDGTNIAAICQDNITVSTTAWTKVNCTFETPASGITSNNTVAFGQLGSGAYTYYVDNMSITEGGTINGGGTAGPSVQIGNGGTDGGATTLFTLDKSGAAPIAANNDALLGSMYYDTDLGKVQCFEADGWGACGASPDTFVTLSAEYSNAVMHGSGTGTMTSDLCSDALNINDGSSSQPTICGTNETNNFYKWTSPSASAQTRSIFVTYQLPSNFKGFANGTTNVMAKTDSTNSTVDYEIYRNNGATGLTACGSTVSVSTGVKTTWQKAAATGTADPSTCNFTAGDSLVMRINLTSSSNANAYVGNLNFTFNNQ
ncbi:carbohydrate binding domain-containing protein [Candidatus Saccharibacteria bacterium]|nr:carbohydrate binding domain-containing protein [Candidatus Saccharibacteria bacterium]